MRINFNSIKVKFLIFIVVMVVSLGGLVILLVGPAMTSKLEMELLKKGKFMTGHLADMAAEHMLKEEYMHLNLMFDQFLLQDIDALYVFTVNSKQQVVEHTFKAGFPQGLDRINVPEPGAGTGVKGLLLGGEKVLDIAAPIMAGKLGVLHLGLSESSVSSSTREVVSLIIRGILTILFLGVLLAIYLAGKLTRPLDELVKVTDAVGQGDLETKVRVTSSDELGKLGGAFNQMISDLRETTVSRKEYQRQSEFLHNILEAIPYSFYVVDVKNYQIVMANSALAAEDRWRGKTCHWLTRNSDEPCGKSTDNQCPLDTIKKTGRPVTLEHRHHNKNGEQRHFEVHGYPIFDDQGELRMMIEFSIDITDRKEIELKLFNSQKVLELKNKEIEQNRKKLQDALAEISEFIQSVARLGDFTGRFKNRDLAKCYEVLQCRNEKCACFGVNIPVRCWQVAGTYCGGKPQGDFAMKIKDCIKCEIYQAATSDVVMRVGESFNNMMHILENKNAELQQAYGELQDAQSQMLQREKMATIGQLAAGVAHEINNPMGFITSNLGSLRKYVERFAGFIEIQSEQLKELGAAEQLTETRKKLKLDFLLEDSRDLLTESLDGAKRVTDIVKNLKSFSRVDTDGESWYDINECLEFTLKIIWNELKYNCNVHKEYGVLPKTCCNSQELNQVFMNILVNAAQAIDKQGDIIIRTWAEGNRIKVAISDTGSGIDGDKVARIFEPFFTTKPVGKGTGLGLSICYDIIKKHGGEIGVASAEGKGTTFTITLPVTEKAA